MHHNIELVIERGENLDDLTTKSEELSQHGNIFRIKTVKLKRKFCRQHCFMQMGLICGVLLVVAILVLVIYFFFK